ncbi:MAG TPA: transglycosylase domain-containing protein [Candidatus Acidoferrales bacterium]|nr:transglycosylase domain-containing protein [Candidatus Acidoferrales bacterium]
MKNSPSLRGFFQIFSPSLFGPRVNHFVHSDAPAVKIVRRWSIRILLLLGFVGLVAYELRTSTLEAWLLARYSKRLSYTVGAGPSAEIAFPKHGPYDERLGYSRIPEFQSRLQSSGFEIREQARLSPALARLIRWGIAPPYREPATPGLEIRDSTGKLLYRAAQTHRFFSNYGEIPPLIVKTLLFIENQELEAPPSPRTNPVIQWERLAKAGLLYLESKLGLSDSVQGGSTLATQIEKFRHSPQGRTQSAWDKARQIVGASLKAYRDGTDTRPRRQEIILDYLNSVPLSAVPGYGEVNGIGEGLYAWFGMQPDAVWKALHAPGLAAAKIKAYKHALALLVSLPAPTSFLIKDRGALSRRVNVYTRLLEKAGIIDSEFATALVKEPIQFAPAAPLANPPSFSKEKAANAARAALLQVLDMPDLYSLDRLHLEVETTIDAGLQSAATRLFHSLTDPEFARSHGLNQERLLEDSDARKVIYSLLLFERTPEGNFLRVQADNLDQPFDINSGVKLELGSTAKLRTLAHYLEIVALLHKEFSEMEEGLLAQWSQRGRDPITRWAAETLMAEKGLTLREFLDRALERRYSASPYETFFTGRGLHTFENFDRLDNTRIFSVREALQHSTNLVFIRLMRDLVRYHQARLPYDAAAVLSDPKDPRRRALLIEEAEEESKAVLLQAYRLYSGQPVDTIVKRLLGGRKESARRYAILFFAWNRNGDEEALAAWLNRYYPVAADEVARLYRAYANPKLDLADFGYLLSIHPLHVWCAGELARKPEMTWEEVLNRSSAPRRTSYAWLLSPRNRRAQDLRLRIRFEKDAFERMTPYWQRLGFPFERLVPSYATAIGSSSDRPSALADLMGVIADDGVRRPAVAMRALRFAAATPYETTFTPKSASGERVMEPEVARALKDVLAGVVELGTARRLRGAFVDAEGNPIKVGGKTGSGDNRYKTFNRYGNETSSRAVNRTATFVFYIGDRYYGVITSFVPGKEAGQYQFTSALPVTVIKLLAPAIGERLKENSAPSQAATSVKS